jgi:diguanylate cyclase (GGDEF)-like protein
MKESVDHLEKQLPNLMTEERVDALNELADYYIKRNNHHALKLSLEAHDLAVESKYDKGLAESLHHIGSSQFRLSNYDAADLKLSESLQKFENLNDEHGQARSLLTLGSVYLRRGEYPKAQEHYLASLAKYQKLGLKQEESKCHNNLAIIHSDLGNYATALEYYLQALEMAEASEDDALKNKEREYISVILSNIGDTLRQMERLEESLEYFQRSLAIAREINSINDENVALTCVCEIYIELGRHEEARELLQDALILSRHLGDRERELRVYGMLGKNCAALGDDKASLLNFYRGLKLSRGFFNPQGEVWFQLTFSKYLLQAGKFKYALKHLKKSLEIAERVNFQHEACQAHEMLVAVYERTDDFRQALYHQKEFQTLKQRLHGEKQDSRIEALLVRHDIEKTRQFAATQQALNEKLQQTNEELAKANQRNQRLLEQLRHQAQHDILTGLPNRSLFEDRLRQSVAQASRYNQGFAVMFVDLDGFKLVNDTLGHQAGDELLVQIAKRFKLVLRESDTLARLGGDEFTVIAHKINEPNDAAIVARKLFKSLENSFELRGHKVSVGASIGISLYPQDGEDIITLQKHADVAMYHVKRGGKKDVRFFSRGMNTAALERVQIESQMRGALERGDFEVYYQPQFETNGQKRIIGFEALLRWTDPKMGAVSPDKFIPVAEETGLIVSIGNWVLNEASRQLAEWQRAGHNLSIAVNISPNQFVGDDFTRTVAEILHRYKIAPSSLELELTERVMLFNQTDIAEKLKELRKTGVRVAIDDFGTGQSALTYLLQLPVDTLKVDKTFIRDLEASPEIRRLVQAIIALSHSMGLAVVAEGVETAEQLSVLQTFGCERTQGYLQGHPMPKESASSLLSSQIN